MGIEVSWDDVGQTVEALIDHFVLQEKREEDLIKLTEQLMKYLRLK